MFRFLSIVLVVSGLAGAALGQNDVLASGNPPLTAKLVTRLDSVYERLLNITLSEAERSKLQQGLIKYWVEHNRDGINSSLTNAKYFDTPDELAQLRESSQTTIVENLRRDAAETNDKVSAVLVDAYDRAHPQMRQATRTMTFKDLVGTWKRLDALLSDRNPNSGEPFGVSYTDSASLEISANGEFALVKVHNHCSGKCCRLDGSEEFGQASLEPGKLSFRTLRGSKLTDDACLGTKQRTATSAHNDLFAWSVRTNPSNDAATLCLSSADGKSQCFEKQ